jgi:hypothetical protein
MTPINSITELYANPRDYPAENIVKCIKHHFLIRRIAEDPYPGEGFLITAYSDIVTCTVCILSLAVICLRLASPSFILQAQIGIRPSECCFSGPFVSDVMNEVPQLNGGRGFPLSRHSGSWHMDIPMIIDRTYQEVH